MLADKTISAALLDLTRRRDMRTVIRTRTVMERKWNGNGTDMERKGNGTGTGTERERNGTGNGTRTKEVQ